MASRTCGSGYFFAIGISFSRFSWVGRAGKAPSVTGSPSPASADMFGTIPQVLTVMSRRLRHSPFRVPDDPQETDQGVVVVQRLPASHDHHMADPLPGGPFHLHNLGDHLAGAQIPHPSADGGGTEPAPHAAPDLGGDAGRQTIAVTHENGFDHIAVLQRKQELHGSIDL